MIEKQKFGSTQHLSSRTIFGAAAFWKITQDRAAVILDLLLKYGVNHIDTASNYGSSEITLGHWMAEHRNQFFLATKTEKRTYNEAWESINRSLERLQVPSIDLLQFHNLTDPKEWDTVMSKDGALKAAIEAKDQGIVKHIGITGHGYTVAEMHIKSLERFEFDSVLLPYNYTMMQNENYARNFEKLSDICKERRIAIQTIKSIARRPWGDREQTKNTWYEPFEEQQDIDRAVFWVLNSPGIFLNTAGDIRLLPQILDAAERFNPKSDDKIMEEESEKLGMKPIYNGRDIIFKS